MADHLVIDLADVQQALVKEDLMIFTEFTKQIAQSREARGLPRNASYILCNTNAPYSGLVTEVIRQGDAVQHAHNMLARLAQQMNSMTHPAAQGDPSVKPLDLGETNDPD